VDQPYDANPGNGGNLGQNFNPNNGGARNGGNFNGGNVNGGAFNGGNFNGGAVNNGGVWNGGLNGGVNVGPYVGGNVTDTGPITGANFADWANRLRTVQNLIDDPQLRQQVANALAQAQDMRRNYLRNRIPPQWNLVTSTVIEPLNQVNTALHQQLLRAEQPNSLQPVDQEPVPDKYANAVKRYYEALGN
jgi:hypothetical protein